MKYLTVIKSVDIFSCAKIFTLFAIILGLIAGIVVAIMGTAVGALFDMPGVTTFGLLSIIVFPIIAAILTFILSAIFAYLYNIFAVSIGGIEVEFAEKKA